MSIVVPTYNNAPYVDATMHSILSQTYTDFELIVSDHSCIPADADNHCLLAVHVTILVCAAPGREAAPVTVPFVL